MAVFLQVLLIAGIVICVFGAPVIYFLLTTPIRRFPGGAAPVIYRKRKREYAQDEPVMFIRKKLERNERWFRRSTRVTIPLFLVINALVTARVVFWLSSGRVSSSYRPVLILLIAFIWIDWVVPIAMHVVAYRYRCVFREFLDRQ